ncbi:ATP-binding protein, partial [Streptococcus suis]
KACRDNRSVLYTRLPRLIDELTVAKGDGRIAARMKSLARVELLILDDWGLQPLDGNARHHLLEILEDRYGQRSTLVTSQLPVARWHQTINDPT